MATGYERQMYQDIEQAAKMLTSIANSLQELNSAAEDLREAVKQQSLDLASELSAVHDELVELRNAVVAYGS